MSSASNAETVLARSRAILAEGIRLQYESMSTAYIASGALATVVALIYRQSMPTAVWVLWLLAMYLHVWARWRLRRRFFESRPSVNHISRWGTYATLGALSSGVLWGVGTVLGLIYGERIMELLMVPMILLFTVAAAISAVSYLPVYYAFFIPSTLPGITVLLLESDGVRFLTGIAYLLFMLMVTRFAHVLHHSYAASTRLRLENAELVDELRAEKAAAEAANLAKSKFLAAASHDLRQPMHALSLFIASYPTANLPAHEAEIIANMRRSSDAMGSLFDALLDISRLDAGTVESHPEHFDVAQLGTRLYREFSPLARTKGLTLRLRSTSQTVHADPVLLNRVVANLLANAIRYGARDGVLLALRPRAGRLAIEVWDTGIGIAEADFDAIFREFYQVGNAERDREKGLGLGLAIVERLVRLMGLSIEVRSKVGVGSMFRVYVPLGSREAVVNSPVEGASAAASVPPRHALNVIVIDDERSVREATRLLLLGWGCSVVAAASARELVEPEVASVDAPDLIIADLRLRGDETGTQAIAALRAHFGRVIPGVIISGDTLPERLQHVQDSGMPILHKPLRVEKLRELLTAIEQDKLASARREVATTPPHPPHA